MAFRGFRYHPDAEEGLEALLARGDVAFAELKRRIQRVQSEWEPDEDDDGPLLVVPFEDFFLIFTVAGDLVWESVQNNNGGNVTWDLTNRGGEAVTSGVYIYRVETPPGDSVYGRIVVIR